METGKLTPTGMTQRKIRRHPPELIKKVLLEPFKNTDDYIQWICSNASWYTRERIRAYAYYIAEWIAHYHIREVDLLWPRHKNESDYLILERESRIALGYRCIDCPTCSKTHLLHQDKIIGTGKLSREKKECLFCGTYFPNMIDPLARKFIVTVDLKYEQLKKYKARKVKINGRKTFELYTGKKIKSRPILDINLYLIVDGVALRLASGSSRKSGFMNILNQVVMYGKLKRMDLELI